ncbi:MAG: hypothetical protein ACTHK5_02550 [Tsuneonella sp.]
MAAIPNVANTANMNQNKYGLSALFAPTPPPPITPNFKAMSNTEAIRNIAINGPTLPIFHPRTPAAAIPDKTNHTPSNM